MAHSFDVRIRFTEASFDGAKRVKQYPMKDYVPTDDVAAAARLAHARFADPKHGAGGGVVVEAVRFPGGDWQDVGEMFHLTIETTVSTDSVVYARTAEDALAFAEQKSFPPRVTSRVVGIRKGGET